MADLPETHPTPTPEAIDESPAARRKRHGRLWNLPNQLTTARLVLSVLFFVLLAVAPDGLLGMSRQLTLNIAFVLFITAVVTDFLDGFFARRWGLTSTFGRIADPFADKIVICGGFVMMTSVSPSLVAPWFAVVVLFREFLVSGLRSFLESRGVAFGAALSGKLKMVSQSITIPVILFYEANFARESGAVLPGEEPGAAHDFFWWLAVFFLVVTLLLTVGSCVGYLQRAYRLIRTESAG